MSDLDQLNRRVAKLRGWRIGEKWVSWVSPKRGPTKSRVWELWDDNRGAARTEYKSAIEAEAAMPQFTESLDACLPLIEEMVSSNGLRIWGEAGVYHIASGSWGTGPYETIPVAIAKLWLQLVGQGVIKPKEEGKHG